MMSKLGNLCLSRGTYRGVVALGVTIYAVCCPHAMADVVVPLTIASEPIHGENFSQDNNSTGVYDDWRIQAPDFPALTSESGNLIFQVRTPHGKRLAVERQAEFFSVGLIWSFRFPVDRQSVTTLPTSITFLDATNFSSSQLRNRTVGASGKLTSPNEINSIGALIDSASLASSWGFSGFDIVVPISPITQQFERSGIPASASTESSFGMTFGFTLNGGDFRNSAAASQFTRLVPEPSGSHLALGIVFSLCCAIRTTTKDL